MSVYLKYTSLVNVQAAFHSFLSSQAGPCSSDRALCQRLNMPNTQLLFAPFVIGAFANIFLYGILVVQAFIYFRSYRKDSARLRYFILFLVICDTVNTVFDIGVVYEPLVFRYGTPRAMERVPILLPLDPLITVIISSSVQLFICRRIKIITKSSIIPGFICIFIFTSFVGGVATCICGSIFNEFARLKRIDGTVITWLASSAIADISITTSLVISLARRRTGNSKTDDAIDRIIRLTIHTGAVTAFFATMDMVLFVAIPNNTLNFAFDFPLTKLYTNSLLSTLNAREGVYDGRHTHDNVLFGPSSWNVKSNTSRTSTISNGRKRDMYTHSQTTIKTSNVIELSSLPGAVTSTRYQQRSEQAFNVDLESAADVKEMGLITT